MPLVRLCVSIFFRPTKGLENYSSQASTSSPEVQLCWSPVVLWAWLIDVLSANQEVNSEAAALLVDIPALPQARFPHGPATETVAALCTSINI